VRVTGRLKDLIIRGGENIAPVSIEDAIRERFPEVSDVSVVGVPDEYYGEIVVAFVMLRENAKLDQADIQAGLSGMLPHFAVPAHVRFVEDFPTTPSGKIQKFELRRLFATGAFSGVQN
jgi:fatty-acyl-CoA synthase